MELHAIRNRQLALLKRLARAVAFRRDHAVLLADFTPSILVAGDNEHFIDLESGDGNPSDVAYDLNCLYTEGAIKIGVASVLVDSQGRVLSKPLISVTAEGLFILRDESTWWITKAIDKQPMTFVQIIFTLVLSILTAGIGWIVGRYQACDNGKQVLIEENPAGPRSNDKLTEGK